jgi:DNA-binding XRE family transcriptional regulator
VTASSAKRTRKPRTWRSAARSSPLVGAALVRLGKRARRLRLAKELSQEEVAERAALDPKHYQAIEGGHTNVTLATLLGIARALGIKVAELLKGV